MKNEEYLPFSIREGYVKPEEILKLNSKGMTKELRIALWNEIYILLRDLYKYNSKLCFDFFFELWRLFMNKNIRHMPGKAWDYHINQFEQDFFKLEWFKVYDLLEFIVVYLNNLGSVDYLITLNLDHLITSIFFSEDIFERWVEDINSALKRNFAPYRLLKEGLVVPITNETEIKTIEEALKKSYGKFAPVYEHLKKSIKFFSHRENPDYENAIKEAVSALESLANILLDKKGKSLTALHQKLASELNLPKFAELQIKELYNWASNSPIRHGTGEKPNVIGQEEAYLILVQTSALINYLISKARELSEEEQK